MAAPIIIETDLKPISTKETTDRVKREFKSAFEQIAAESQKAAQQIQGSLGAAGSAAQKFGSDFKNSLGGLSSLLGPAGILGAITAVGAGLFGLAKQAGEFSNKVAELSAKTGLTTETLSGLDVILRENNSSLDSFSRSFTFFQRQLGEAQAGNKKTAEEFRKLGIDIKATSEDALRQVIVRYQQLPNEAQKAAFAQRVFGKSGSELQQTLGELGGDLDGTIKLLRDLGLIVTPKATEEGKRFDAQMERLGRTAEGLKLQIGNAVLPFFNSFIEGAQNALDALRQFTTSDAFNLLLSGGNLAKIGTDLALSRVQRGIVPPVPIKESDVNKSLPSDLLRTGERKERLSELDQLDKQYRKLVESTNQLSQSDSALFDLTVKLKVEELERARAMEKVNLEFERRVGIVRLPDANADRRVVFADEQINPDLIKGLPKVVNDVLVPLPPIKRELSEMERFMEGFARATFTAADAFEDFGRNVANAFSSAQGLLSGLSRAVKQFFSDLVGAALQSTVKSAFASIFGGGNGGGGIFGSIFGGGGSGISVPGSASARTPPFIPNLFGGFGGGSAATVGGRSIPTLGLPGASAAGPGGTGGFFGNLSRSGALPLLGASFGAGFGGSSILGNIAGGIGGGLLGIGLTAAPTSGALAGLAPLFSNPITAIAGGALLVGSIFLGKAKQRGKDEQVAGDLERQAYQAIVKINDLVNTDQIVGADQARSAFESQVLNPFQQEISTLKTKSVVQSRLNNTVPNLRRDFENLVINQSIAAQQQRIANEQRRQQDDLDRQQRNAAAFARQIPEFARGGIVPGRDLGYDSVTAMLRPGELVLTAGQQSVVKALAGGNIFNAAGVPGSGQQIGNAQAFAGGGTVQRVSPRHDDATVVIENLTIGFGMSNNDARQIFVTGGMTEDGKKVIVNRIKTAQVNREL
jgi:hypothetical protein